MRGRVQRASWLALALVVAIALAALRVAADDTSGAANPHGKFREACSNCHGPDSWKIARMGPKFDHAKYGFGLEGAHASAACTACHVSLDFSATEARCVTCHQDVHHGEMGDECARCHGARSFVDRGPMIRLHQITAFPLAGSHAALDCVSCHPGTSAGQRQFAGTQAECRACHMPQYQSARTPDHAAGGFPLTCQQCHSAVQWSPARFNHDAIGFPLRGAHRAVACTECHPGSRYAGTPRECIACHQADYDAATPPHPAAGFTPSLCASCHGFDGWSPSTFDHSRTSFPLSGAHVSVECTTCHVNAVYDGTPTACIACHQSDYDSATPNHATAGFTPGACATCHSTTRWDGASFNHDAAWFPIYSGKHRNTWSECATCHTSSSNYAVYTCFSCHPHDDQAATDRKHSEVRNYRYESSACYSCHPRGTAN